MGQKTYDQSVRSSLTRSYRKNRLAPANFICSGLVQYGFLRTVHDLSKKDGSAVPTEGVAEVIFDEGLRQLGAEAVLRGSPEAWADLLATTPDEVSRAPTLQWKYLILEGKVHAVASRDDVIKEL